MLCRIRTEEARRVLAQAVWEAAASRFDGDQLFFAMIDYSWTFVHPAYGDDVDGAQPAVVVSELFEVLDRARAASDRLAIAAVGDLVEVPLEPEELEVQLSNVEARLEQKPFSELAVDDQKDVLLCIDAARKLREALITAG